jgi:2-C-methyl-D-erythritol 4-phosphate cytidylyltransferase
MDTWRSLCARHNFSKPLMLQSGGETRFQSVKNGLKKIDDDNGLVAIHDGVRPLISENIIGASFRLAAVHHRLLLRCG